ncbi:DUF2155 domain-containing protein [Candidatus Magnetomonas plexicatena]|uniref:DUF2155 domain-containing protein n=1 Tax=Candidatus Magnetomonas plexicatena TaxID=2552947 RepID=UPI001C7696AB|nr:DUF2155 domain-containing protein [Nitrospirales bacterium LBB_01]
MSKAVIYVLLILFSFVSACSKHNEPVSEVPKNPAQYLVSQAPHTAETQAQEKSHGKIDMKSQKDNGDKDSGKHKVEILVPDDVKNTWESVKLLITDKKTAKKETPEIKLNTDYKINGTDIVIKVGQFLPDFRMDTITITSMSNEPNNPAVNVTITEGGKEIFTGWLYSKFPDVHPFEHNKYAVTLVEGIRKK